MKLAIYTCATEGYAYALGAQARRVQKCLYACKRDFEVLVVIVTEGCDAAVAAFEEWQKLLPDAQVELIADGALKKGDKSYDNSSQLLIAQMRTLATSRAVAWGADMCWSLDSDVLPPANALTCMINMLEFDDGYYGVAACPYPSQGGGMFLCGRGTPQEPILPCFDESERDVPDELLENKKAATDRAEKLSKENKPLDKNLRGYLNSLRREIDGCPPKDNVFALNGKQWRRRGWFDNAYPAIGKGAVVPTDWCGFGCTLMGRDALANCDFSGYDGSGTEDLYINWHRWYPNDIKIAAISHCPCDHVVRHRHVEGKIVHVATGHEQQGEFVGHLRQSARPWYAHHPGEVYDESNDGNLYPVDSGDGEEGGSF